MADPISITMGVIGMAMSAVGTMSAAGAQRQQGEAAKMQAQQQAGMYAYNAQIAEANGIEAKAAADRNAEIQRQKVGNLLSTQRAMYAKAGVDTSEGSPLLVEEDTAARGEFDAKVMEHEGDMGLWRARNQVAQDQYGGSAALWGGDMQANALDSAAGTTLLTGMGKTAMQAGSMWGKNSIYPQTSINMNNYFPFDGVK